MPEEAESTTISMEASVSGEGELCNQETDNNNSSQSKTQPGGAGEGEIAVAPLPSSRNAPPGTPMVSRSAEGNGRRLLPEFNEAVATETISPRRVPDAVQNSILGQDQYRRSSSDLHEPHSDSQSSKESLPGTQSYKDMLERVKELHEASDKLQERIFQLHHDFADVIIKGALIFTPEALQILNSTEEIGIGDIPDPDEVHFMRDEVVGRYAAAPWMSSTGGK